ncbi:MAG: hypothetical protein LBP53_05920 [Candidatus Peribacteria bacterium]|jgi:hypothetical protein|nr:hypothetical protein [Candidatus Peribacteria bacterium]
MLNSKESRLTSIGGCVILIGLFVFVLSCGNSSHRQLVVDSQPVEKTELQSTRRIDSTLVVWKQELIESSQAILEDINRQLVGQEKAVEKVEMIISNYQDKSRRINKLHNNHLYVYCAHNPQYKIVKGYANSSDNGEYDLFQQSGFVRLYLELNGEKPESFKFMSEIDGFAKEIGIETRFMNGTKFRNIKITPEMDKCQKDREDELLSLSNQTIAALSMGNLEEVLDLLEQKEIYEMRKEEASEKIKEIRANYGENFPY